MKDKTKMFPFCPYNKTSLQDNFTPSMNRNKSNTYAQTNKLLRDWTNIKKHLLRYSMLNVFLYLV